MDRLLIFAALVGILILSFPHISLAQTVSTAPLVFEINNLENVPAPQDNYLAQALADDIYTQPLYIKAQALREYLESKNSPMAEYAVILVRQYHYRLVIGISFAESNFCKIQIRANNCWGIGGSYPENYPSLAEGIVRANDLIQKYHDLGMTTPKLMRNSWVGWQNDNWIIAVNQVTQEMEELGL